VYVVPAALVFIDYLEGQRFETLILVKSINPSDSYLFTLARENNNYTVFNETDEEYRNFSLNPRQNEMPGIYDVETNNLVVITSFVDNEYELTDEETGRKLALRKIEDLVYELIEEEEYLLQLE
jgi:hypothetical protein